MTRNFRKEIYTRSRFRNKFCKNPTLENEKLYKKQRNKRVAVRRKCIREYFHNITDNNIVRNKNVWNFLRSFLINKGSLNSCEIMLKKENKIITDTKVSFSNLVERCVSDLNGEEIAGTFRKKELQKTNQKKFRIEKVIKKKRH